MPNWCYNNMDIYGESSELQKFVEATKIVGEDGITEYGLSHLFPVPQELVDTTSGWFSDPDEQAKQTAKEEANLAKYGHKDWYDWSIANWGTKWGDSDFDWRSFGDETMVAPEETYISAYYQTAWSPADGLIRNISAKFPSLTFSVVSTEESDAYACYSIFRDGKLLAEGGEEPKRPKELEEHPEEYDEEFYDKLNDWQCQTSDRWSGEADKALGKILIDNK